MWFYLALLSAFFNALANVARRTHGSLAQPAELSWWCLLFGIPLNIGLLFVSNEPMWTSNDYILPALASATLNAFGGVMVFRAYKYGDASVVSPLGNLLPIALLVTSFIMLGIVPSAQGLLGILLVVAGVYYSSVSGKHALTHPFKQITKNKGLRAVLVWVALMSVSNVLITVALRSASPAYLMLIMVLWELGMLSVYLLFRRQKQRIKRGEQVIRKWGWHIAAISVFASLAVFFQFQAMQYIDPSYVLSVKRIDVLFTVLLAGLFLKEKHILRRFKGSLIAVVGVAIIFLAA